MTGTILATALALVGLACSSTVNPEAPKVSAQGQHPANWLENHWAEFVKAPDQCRSCHGSTRDPQQAGGIAKVSCFTCHPNGPEHPADWALPGQHGRLGAQLLPTTTSFVNGAVVKGVGFASCTRCHGSNYDNPLGTATSCKACHSTAPHPAKPWIAGTKSSPTHDASDPANAPECFKCHAGGANSPLKPVTVAPAGTQPGCFNATLCHERPLA
jgi:hypothetical protein